MYSGERRWLKYTFYVQPGCDVGEIQMEYEGVEKVSVDEKTGELVMQTSFGEIRDAKPVAYQVENFDEDGEIEGVRCVKPSRESGKAVDISFRLIGEKRVGFAVGDYDPNFMLALDPGYSTYLGGSGGEIGFGIAVDSSGNVYVMGDTTSSNFPTLFPYQRSNAGDYDVFVTKIDTMRSGNDSLVYSTYLGGDRDAFVASTRWQKFLTPLMLSLGE